MYTIVLALGSSILTIYLTLMLNSNLVATLTLSPAYGLLKAEKNNVIRGNGTGI